MQLEFVDWGIVIAFFIVSLIIGLAVSRQAGKSLSEYFLSGRNMPWWLLGVSMVATTFSADTPNLVTDFVRQNGVAANWQWWAFLLTGMLTVFVYSKLWRRSEVLTDLEFYELRYSGKIAAFLRGFRAVYLGFFFNIMIMATVCLAAIKIGGVLLDMTPVQVLLIASVVTVIYSALGGLKGVLITDFVQFILAMIGSVWAAYYIVNLPEVGGLNALLSHHEVQDKIRLLPDFNSPETLIPLFVIPIAVQWWNVWYPGAEPGGGGYIAQRMLSAKDETNAIGATFFFNVAHYALRPWPWILIALASIVVFPHLSDIQAAFPNVDASIIKHDLAYPAMLTYLPHGLLGLVIASLIAAFMSTISTHLNWGSSYLVNDIYLRFIRPDAPQKSLVIVGRVCTVVLMFFAALLALALNNAVEAFEILLTIGAGTGLIFILRWFWWRINAYTELTGMFVSFCIALYFKFLHHRLGFPDLPNHYELVISILLTTVAWVTVTLLTRPTDSRTLQKFYKKIRPGGPGWKPVAAQVPDSEVTGTSRLTAEIACVFLGSFAVYTALFTFGYWIYGRLVLSGILAVVTIVLFYLLIRVWNNKVKQGVG